MTIPSKVAGSLSLMSCLYDMHKGGQIQSNVSYAKTASDSYLECAIGASRANRVSYKDSARKNWLLKNNFVGRIKEPISKVTGYVKGFLETGLRYIPNFGLSAVALLAKNKRLANIAAVALGGVEAFDFLKNSTSLFQKTDYLK